MSDSKTKHSIHSEQLLQTMFRLINYKRKSLQKLLLNCSATASSMLVIKLYILIVILTIQCHKLFASNLPLLSGTLRTFQVHACDGEELKLECLPNTVISIYLAQYGRNVPSHQLCPNSLKTDQSSSQSTHNSSQLFNSNDTSDCLTSDALRYSLLQKVESSCREQRICKFMTSPQSFGGIDPCPGVRKYAEIAFKCRPNTFYNKVICEGNRLRLKCHKSSRIVIYSASFGSTSVSVPECPQLTSSQPISQSLTNSEECQVSYATETVMSSCHGRKKCSLDAEIGTFGDPGCSKTTKLHLKVVYTCVPKDVLKELDIGVTDNDKSSNSDVSTNEDSVDTSDYVGFVEEPRYIPDSDISSTPYPSGHREDESNYKVLKAGLAVVPTKKTFIKSDIVMKNNYNIANNKSLDSDNDVNCTIITPPERVIGFISDWISAISFIKKNTERFVLYLLVSFCGSLVCFLIVLSFRLYVQKRRAIKKVKEDLPTCTPFGGLSEEHVDDILDQLDGVTTLTEPLNHSHGHNHLHHHHSIEVVRYGNPGTSSHTNTANRNSSIRRQNSDTNPRSMTRSLNNYYYN